MYTRNCAFPDAHGDGDYMSAPCKLHRCGQCTGLAIGPDGFTDCECCCHDLDKIETRDANREMFY